MKRTLVLAALLALLYERQRRVERRQLAWKTHRETEMRDWATEINRNLERFGKNNADWGTKLVKEIEVAIFKGALRQ